MSAFIDLAGMIFGRLTVLKQTKKENGRIFWLCHCECGNKKHISGKDLTLQNRLKYLGWSIERALTTPVEGRV